MHRNVHTVTTIYSPTEKLWAGFNGPAYSPLIYPALDFALGSFFALGLYLFLAKQSCWCAQYMQSRCTLVDLSLSKGSREWEQRSKRRTLETRKDGRREREKEKEKRQKPHALGTVHYLGMKECQGLVHVFDFVNSHASIIGFSQSLAGNDL